MCVRVYEREIERERERCGHVAKLTKSPHGKLDEGHYKMSISQIFPIAQGRFTNPPTVNNYKPQQFYYARLNSSITLQTSYLQFPLDLSTPTTHRHTLSAMAIRTHSVIPNAKQVLKQQCLHSKNRKQFQKGTSQFM